MFFYLSKLPVFFLEIRKNPMRVLGRKKTHVFFGNALPKSNARAHLKQRKKHSGLSELPPPQRRLYKMCRIYFNYWYEATDTRQQELLNETDSMGRRLTNE